MEKNECSLAIQILPISSNKDDKIRLDIISKIIEYIQSTGLAYMVGPFETTIEGDLNTLMNLAKTCQTIAIKEGADSVMSYVKIFYNPKGVLSIKEKTDPYK